MKGLSMNPFIALLLQVIDLIQIAIIVWFVMRLLMYFNIVNRSHPFVFKLDDVLSRLIDPLLRPFRRFIPVVSGIDLSPVVLILLLNFVQHSLLYYF